MFRASPDAVDLTAPLSTDYALYSDGKAVWDAGADPKNASRKLCLITGDVSRGMPYTNANGTPSRILVTDAVYSIDCYWLIPPTDTLQVDHADLRILFLNMVRQRNKTVLAVILCVEGGKNYITGQFLLSSVTLFQDACLSDPNITSTLNTIYDTADNLDFDMLDDIAKRLAAWVIERGDEPLTSYVVYW